MNTIKIILVFVGAIYTLGLMGGLIAFMITETIARMLMIEFTEKAQKAYLIRVILWPISKYIKKLSK